MANITFSTADEAAAALAVNGTDFNGRSLSVEVALPRDNNKKDFKSTGDKEPNTSCFIGNLSWEVTEEAIREAFGGASPFSPTPCTRNCVHQRVISFVLCLSLRRSCVVVRARQPLCLCCAGAVLVVCCRVLVTGVVTLTACHPFLLCT